MTIIPCRISSEDNTTFPPHKHFQVWWDSESIQVTLCADDSWFISCCKLLWKQYDREDLISESTDVLLHFLFKICTREQKRNCLKQISLLKDNINAFRPVKAMSSDAFFCSTDRMLFGWKFYAETRMRNATHSDDCPHDVSEISRFSVTRINLLRSTFWQRLTNVT